MEACRINKKIVTENNIYNKIKIADPTWTNEDKEQKKRLYNIL